MPNLTMHDPRLMKASVLRSTYIPECKVLHVAKLVLVRATRSCPEAHEISRSACRGLRSVSELVDVGEVFTV